MTAIDTHIFQSDSAPDLLAAHRSTLVLVLSCAFIAAMFMLATNDPSATAKWESTTREQVGNLSIALESGRAVRQIAFISLGLWGAFTLFFFRRRLRLNPVFLLPLALLIGWASLSILWSQDRAFTGKRLVLMGCMASAVIAFACSFRVRDLALLAVIGGAMQLTGSAIFDLLYATGHYGNSGYRFSGLQHPNHTGISAMFFIFGCIYYLDRTHLRHFLVPLVLACIIMYLTKSRSSLIAGVAAISVFAMLRWRPRTILFLGFGGLCFTGLFFMMVASGVVSNEWSNIIHMGREDSQAAALTGRPQIWAAAHEWLGNDSSRLLLGVGYDSFWTPEAAMYVSNRVWFRISEGHCAYFDTLLELGVIGVLSYAYLLLASLIRYARLSWVNESGAHAFAAMIFVFAFIHGLTESTTVDPNLSTFFSFTAISMLALRSPRMRIADDEVPT